VNQDGVKFQTKGATDVLVQTITFQPKGNLGWHFHPGVVLVVVESGTVTPHDADCETRTYGPHSSFVESGTAPFMVSNESQTENAVVYATLVVPAGVLLGSKPHRLRAPRRKGTTSIQLSRLYHRARVHLTDPGDTSPFSYAHTTS
jgi:quercetin dioxygenase-like cupin family protein